MGDLIPLPGFEPAWKVINLHLAHTIGQGWTVRVYGRREGDPSTADKLQEQYCDLTPSEVLTVTDSELEMLLGL